MALSKTTFATTDCGFAVFPFAYAQGRWSRPRWRKKTFRDSLDNSFRLNAPPRGSRHLVMAVSRAIPLDLRPRAFKIRPYFYPRNRNLGGMNLCGTKDDTTVSTKGDRPPESRLLQRPPSSPPPPHAPHAPHEPLRRHHLNPHGPRITRPLRGTRTKAATIENFRRVKECDRRCTPTVGDTR